MFDSGDGVLGVIGSIPSSSKHGKLSWCWILVSSEHNTFTHFSSESFRCSLANFRRACTCVFLSRRNFWALQDFTPSWRNVLPIVFLVTMVPAALRSLTRSSLVVLGWFLAVLMITETPRGKIVHGAQVRGRLTVQTWWWSCSPFQPCVGLQSWTVLWSWPCWRVWNLIDWLLLCGVFYTGNKLRLGVLPLRECS